MRWQIQQIGFESSGSLAGFVQDKLIRPLSQMASGVRKVVVKLRSDGGGPRPQRCGAAVVIQMNDSQTLHIKHWESCHYSAVERVADRARRAVRSRIERRQDKRRRTRKH